MGLRIISRSACRTLRRGVRGRGPLGWLPVALAVLALASPSLTALNPDWAGWLPSHGHVYEGGVPVPHSHPWDAAPPTAMAFPVADPVTGGPHSHAAEDHAHEHGEGSVVFTWDTASTVKVLSLPTTVGLALGVGWLLRVTRVRPLGLLSTAPAVPTPPPR